MKVVILAAGIGSRLRPYTEKLPKSLVPVNDKPMLAHILDAFKEIGAEEFFIVTGYRNKIIEEFFDNRDENPRFIYNERYNTAGNGYSLLVAKNELQGHDFFKVDSDLVFDPLIAKALLDANGDVRITLDVRDDMGEEEMKVKVDDRGNIIDFSKEIPPHEALGESIGIEYMTKKGGEEVFNELQKMMDEGDINAYYEEAYARLARKGSFVTATKLPKNTKWYEIDNEEDLKQASILFSKK